MGLAHGTLVRIADWGGAFPTAQGSDSAAASHGDAQGNVGLVLPKVGSDVSRSGLTGLFVASEAR